jgi:LacI family transcriptional regulator
MTEVARDAGVSLKTVSRVINGVSTVDAALAARVHASAARLGFQRNALAAMLRSGASTATVGVIIGDFRNSFYSGLVHGAQEVLRPRGYQIFVASSEEDAAAERLLTLDMCERRVNGLIVVPTTADHSYLQTEIDRGTNVVVVDRPVPGLAVDTVLIGNREGAQAAVSQLVDEGHRRIGVLLDSLSIYTMSERLAGATEALAGAGLPPAPELVVTGVHTAEQARSAAAAILELDDPPTALFCGNNLALVGASEAAAAASAVVHITAFDLPETPRLLPFPVTVVEYDAEALGAEAAELLLRRIDGSTARHRTVLLPTRLVTSASILPPHAESAFWQAVAARP